jgi:hypothetical protein
MSALTSAKRAELEERLTKKKALLDKYYDALENAPLDSGMKRYRFDSGEASQSAEYLDPSKLQEQITRLEKQIDSLERTLTGGHFRRFTLNRKPCTRNQY